MKNIFAANLFWQSLSEGYLEKRYEAENAMMNAVAIGDEQEAMKALAEFVSFDFGERFEGTPTRYRHGLTILNTLLRKSIERAGVPPYYIDRISSDFAERIDLITESEERRPLLDEMIREYTRYVREYALLNYSDAVRKVIRYVNMNLDSDLSLKVLSREASMNPGWLSSIFRRETGIALVRYINSQRIFKAAKLIRETHDNIANIASEVGINDENYFTKIFRKFMGITPSKYRALCRKEREN